MRIHVKRTAAVGGAIAALALGGTGVALAQADAPASPQASDGGGQDVEGDNTQDPSYTGSVPAPEDNGTNTSEADEAASLQALATITPDDAAAAALAAVPGTAGAVELDNENGFVVYSVEVIGADGTVIDVKVDAGNGQVLAQDSESGTEGGSESGTESGQD